MWDDGQDGSNEELARRVGCSPATVNTYRQDYHRVLEGDDVLTVTEEDLPLPTRKGEVWCVPIESAVRCEPWDGREGCRLYERCKEAVRLGHFVGCERPLKGELF